MFNVKTLETDECNDGSKVYHGDSSYITSVKWDDFVFPDSLKEYFMKKR